MKTLLEFNKRGQLQIASTLIWGIVGFVLAVIVGMIVIGLLVGGNFFTSTSPEQLAIGNLSSNVTAGVNTIGTKFPTMFTVVAMVVILAIIGLLILVVRKFGMGGGNNFGQ